MKNVKGKIILVDDEPYEEEFLEIALNKKGWDIKIDYFNNVDVALEHLKMNVDEVFLIISDISMPNKNGLEFKQILNDDEFLKQKSIPFIFVSNSLSRKTVLEAYELNVQGFFQKPLTSNAQSEMFEIIVHYWITCIHPNKGDLPDNPHN